MIGLCIPGVDMNSLPRVTFQTSNQATSSLSDTRDMTKWNLSDLYSGTDGKDLKGDLEKVEQKARTFQNDYQGKLKSFIDKSASLKLLGAVESYEELQDLMGRLASFSYLTYALDRSDTENTKFFGDIQEKLTSISSKLLFFTLEINQLPDKELDAFLKKDNLKKYKPWFDDLRKEKKYQLEDDVEKLLHEKSVTGYMAWNRLFNEMITSLKFQIGEHSLPLEPALNLLLDTDETKRQNACDALADTFADNIKTFTLITNTLAKDKSINDRWRGFEDVADSRHLSNRVEKEVVDALINTVRDKYSALSHRYYKLKAQWMGKKILNYWDRNAPVLQESFQKIEWGSAKSIVLDSYRKFSPEVADIVQKFFDKNWIDAPVRDGKAPGAFSHPTVPSAHPYILLNYQGNPRDVMTLAHELGHGVHQYLANEQGALLAPTPLTLAETASVFGEMLTFKALLGKEEDPKKKRALIASKVEDMINTVVRQVAFYTFEHEVHMKRREGELTSDQIAEVWGKIQKESLGPYVNIEDRYGNFWCYIPHFIHSPFYVYAYAFGECLVNSLYAVYEKSSEGFEQKYIKMLRAGGSKHHKELLEPFGLDASDPEFWQLGLKVIENLIDELEET